MTGISGLGNRIWQSTDDSGEVAAKSYTDGVSSENGQTSSSGLVRMDSEPQVFETYSARVPFDDMASQREHGGSSEIPHRSYRHAPSSTERSSRSGSEHWRSDRATGSSRTEASRPHGQSVPDRAAGSGKRRVDDVAAQSVHGTSLERPYRPSNALNTALRDIDQAHDVHGFSGVVVRYARQLRMPDKATFLQKAAADFRYRFVARLEQNIRAGESWSYARSCNEVSGEAGGREGMEACKALAARVSRLDDVIMYEVEDRALPLFAASFGRHSQVPACRRGAIRIAEFCCDESRGLRRQTNQGLSLLVNGFSKWPDAAGCREAAVAIAGEVPSRLSRFDPQALANLVNGLSKWPGAAGCREAAVAIAGEVPSRLSRFDPQALANLVNGFSKWPDRGGLSRGCRRDRR
ncbi:hypothetical protein ACVWY2_009035 [Bradyrhizobium sp. JR6.1]